MNNYSSKKTIKYDFDTVINRRGTGSLKWDVADNELPMWVADMDFQTAPEVMEAINKRASHGIFGYTDVDDQWRNAYAGWWERRHGLKIDKDGLIFCTGVVSAISSIVRKLTTPNENVVIQTPVYNIFFNSIVNNGARVLESPLIYHPFGGSFGHAGEGGDNLFAGEYSIDFDDLERKLADPQTTLMILCNPHNPIGRIWDREILGNIGRLCRKHHVTIISDEIHCDIARPGKEYVPFAAVSEECAMQSITCIAPTKTFNLAGLHTAAIYVPDPVLRHKVWRGVNTDEVGEPGVFATEGAIAAFNHGEEWVNQLNEYLFKNREFAENYLAENINSIRSVYADATYLMWLDISELGSSREVASFIRKTTGLYVTAGAVYGAPGDRFLRMNIACPRRTLEDGLSRLEKAARLWFSI